MTVQYHYRPVQHLVLALLSLAWLVLLPIAGIAAAVLALADVSGHAVTTAQHTILDRPASWAPTPVGSVWRDV